MSLLNCAGRVLDLTTPQVMGILNVTPDSFSDGGRFLLPDTALRHAEQMVAAGAAMIDVGGESTRPNATPISVDEEIRRVVPVIERIAAQLPVPISIDTSKPAVMRAAIAAGAGFINDVRALQLPGALTTAVALKVPVCLMHMSGEPQVMQQAPSYSDVVAEVIDFLRARIAAAVQAGLNLTQIVIDPGFGFGKTLAHNVQLFVHLPELAAIGVPLLVGLSRKSMLGGITGSAVDDRLIESISAAVLAVERGARLIRVHDVAATVRALKVVAAIHAAD
ncbi:dihydropteroate synthase [Rhodopseudomonas palustris]|uniref:Dihydropteroate synthase n=1 Tax=Thiospirillum jenense TaxID=1653858 RepID=A0A839H3H9_9GAMM|nr:dihydropteroate synthase [Thiospirillum jenense]MBB1089753.1 dihydropteroate synthase [Rhodopseudomonas palustris]MBB1124855.1 dihydropteroate synthase [Thiospirillum jenense]